MNMWATSGAIGAGALLVMLILWTRRRTGGRTGDVDVAWSLGLAGAAVVHALFGAGPVERRALIGVMGAVWGLRIARHLHARLAARGEDGRYAALREKMGDKASRWLLLFFVFQAVLVPVLALSFGVAASAARPALDGWDLLGAGIWLVSVTGEAFADRQLSAFVARPENRGRTCRDGLWRYSRHPNYFFEWLHWWAYVPVAFGAGLWWLSPFPSLLMLFLIVKVTGIPPTEEQSVRSRGEDYRKYQRTTSAFFPWAPSEEVA